MYALTLTTVACALATRVAAHGYVQQIKVGNSFYQGYNPTAYPYMNPAPSVAGWTDDDVGIGFVSPSAYQSPDIICHNAATPGTFHIPVTAGQQVELLWTPWPSSHLGPVLTYMANCHGPCTSVADNKTALQFFKVDQAGLLAPGSPGRWATQQLIANNNTWTFTVPAALAPGSYVVRHELIALHAAGSADGAQNYPQCVNLQVAGSGSAKPSGTTPGEKLYTPTDPGILIDIYQQNDNYTIPGPPLYAGAGKVRREFAG